MRSKKLFFNRNFLQKCWSQRKSFFFTQKNTISDELMWFIGFTEGCGSNFYTNGKRLSFIITQAEASVLYKIRSLLGFGSVKVRSDNYYRFVITKREGIKRIIELCNGHLVCQARRKEFSKWLAVWNLTFPQEYIHELESFAKPSFTNAWISGFFDAEVTLVISFSISTPNQAKTENSISGSEDKNRQRVRLRPRIFCDQKDDFDVLQAIADSFKAGRVRKRQSDVKQIYYRWMLDTWIHIPKVIRYLNRYPLRTRKHRVYLRFRKIYQIYLRKEHCTQDGLKPKVRALISRLQL